MKQWWEPSLYGLGPFFTHSHQCFVCLRWRRKLSLVGWGGVALHLFKIVTSLLLLIHCTHNESLTRNLLESAEAAVHPATGHVAFRSHNKSFGSTGRIEDPGGFCVYADRIGFCNSPGTWRIFSVRELRALRMRSSV